MLYSKYLDLLCCTEGSCYCVVQEATAVMYGKHHDLLYSISGTEKSTAP